MVFSPSVSKGSKHKRVKGLLKSLLRVALILSLAACALIFLVFPLVLRQISGAFSHQPSELRSGLTPGARDLLNKAFEDVDPTQLLDYHAHLAGIGAGGTGNFVNPDMRSWLHPIDYLKFSVYLGASGVHSLENADREFVIRLVDQARNIKRHGKYCLLAFDKYYNRDGSLDLNKTELYISNEYVFAVAEEYPDLFEPVISVHPYRSDALEDLEKWSRRGAKMVKWLPNAMGIDPADPGCDSFYERMKKLDLVLLSHVGEEQAVDAVDDQKLGNPLRLRRPLDLGVKVIAAHCASLGEDEDLDHPDKPLLPSFDLFLRLMEEGRYQGLLFGEISAMTQYNRIGRPLATIIDRTDLHSRLVNGSDYPLPAINILIRTRSLVKSGFITEQERDHLNEIYDYNPLLFDFVVKRTIKLPGSDRRLPASVFLRKPARGA